MSIDARDGLVVRRHERRRVRMRAGVSVPRLDSDVLRLSERVPTGASGVEVDLLDIGTGGLGFESDVYFPRGAILDISVFDPDGNGTLLCVRTQVRRTTMVDRTPSYASGVQFLDLQPEALATIERLSREGVV